MAHCISPPTKVDGIGLLLSWILFRKIVVRPSLVRNQKGNFNRLRHPTSDARAAALLQVPVADEERKQAREARGGDDDDEGVVERGNVRVDDGLLELFWELKDDGDGLPDSLEGLRGDLAHVLRQVRVELRAEDGARDRDADSAADKLQERHERRRLWDRLWFVCVLGLDGDDRVLERDASADTEEDLVPDELRRACVDVNGEKETAGGGSDERAEEEEGPVAPCLVDDRA